MSKTTLLIFTLIILTGGLLFLAVRSEQKAPVQTPLQKLQRVPTPKPVVKTATVFFSPSTLEMGAASSTFTVDLMVNSGRANLTGVQVELSFDPTLVSSVSLTPPSALSGVEGFFGAASEYLVLFKDVDQKNGRVSYAIAITPQGKAKTGIGKVGTLSFTLTRPTNRTQTQISFVDKTLVTREGETESILKDTTPLTIQFSSPPVYSPPKY